MRGAPVGAQWEPLDIGAIWPAHAFRSAVQMGRGGTWHLGSAARRGLADAQCCQRWASPCRILRCPRCRTRGPTTRRGDSRSYVGTYVGTARPTRLSENPDCLRTASDREGVGRDRGDSVSTTLRPPHYDRSEARGTANNMSTTVRQSNRNRPRCLDSRLRHQCTSAHKCLLK